MQWRKGQSHTSTNCHLRSYVSCTPLYAKIEAKLGSPRVDGLQASLPSDRYLGGLNRCNRPPLLAFVLESHRAFLLPDNSPFSAGGFIKRFSWTTIFFPPCRLKAHGTCTTFDAFYVRLCVPQMYQNVRQISLTESEVGLGFAIDFASVTILNGTTPCHLHFLCLQQLPPSQNVKLMRRRRKVANMSDCARPGAMLVLLGRERNRAKQKAEDEAAKGKK